MSDESSDSLGKAAYEAYCRDGGWPDPPEWETLNKFHPVVTSAWCAAAKAVEKIIAEDLY
jgi:hypothetical protein